MIARFLLAAALAVGLSGSALAQGPLSLCTRTAIPGNCIPVTASAPLPVVGTFTAVVSTDNFAPVAAGAAIATKSTLLGGQYNSTQKTLTDGQQAALSASARGALFVAPGAEGFTVTGITNTVNTVVTGASFRNITTNTDTNVKASAGTFVGVTVNTAGVTSTVKIYNDADGTCSSGLIATVDTTVLGTALIFNAAATIGICATTAGGGAADITVLYR